MEAFAKAMVLQKIPHEYLYSYDDGLHASYSKGWKFDGETKDEFYFDS